MRYKDKVRKSTLHYHNKIIQSFNVFTLTDKRHIIYIIPIFDSLYAHIIKYIKPITYIVQKYGHQSHIQSTFKGAVKGIFKVIFKDSLLYVSPYKAFLSTT